MKNLSPTVVQKNSGPRLVCYPHTREQTTAVMGLAVVHGSDYTHLQNMSSTFIKIVVNPNICPMVDVGAKHSHTVIKIKVRLCFDVCPTEPCHRIALNRLTAISDLPPGSILSPPSPLWLARVTGLFKVLPPTCRIVPESEKQKPSGSSFPHRSVASFEARKLEPKGSKCLAAMLDGTKYSRKKAPVKQGLNPSWRR